MSRGRLARIAPSLILNHDIVTYLPRYLSAMIEKLNPT